MASPSKIDSTALAGMELFHGLTPEALCDVAALAESRVLPKDTIVFAQGASAVHGHALIDGRVRISQSDGDGEQLIVRFISPGEMFGTMALFTDGRYPAEAVAIVDSIEVTWTEHALLDLIDRHPQIALNMVKVLGRRIRDVQERLRELATQRVERRIAHTLLRLASRAGDVTGNGTAIDFPLTRKDVADMCGATLHTVSRVFTAWEKNGFIASGRQRVAIKSIANIRRIAEDSAD